MRMKKMMSWLCSRRFPPPEALFPARFATPLMRAIMRRRQRNPATASLRVLTLLEARMTGYRWVVAAGSVASHHLCFRTKASSLGSPSSVGLVGDAFGALSTGTRSAHAVGFSDASVVVVLAIESDFAVHAFPPIVLLTLVIALRTHVLLASRAALRPLSLGVSELG
jgi:hypothetical protein